MLKQTLCAAILATGAAVAAMPAAATVIVGGEAMYPTQTIVQNAVNSKDHTTLVAAVQAADLVDILNSDGPFTVFAPVNSAFASLPAGTVDGLLRPENKDTLIGVLTYHVLPYRMTYLEMQSVIQASQGTAEFTTVSGDVLTATMNGPVNITITDENGGVANITIYDVIQSNGVIHSIDRVLLPR